MESLLSRIETYAEAHEVTKGYVKQLRYAVNCYAKFLGRVPTVADLRADSVNKWLVAIADGISPQTVRSYRRHLLVVWHDCIDAELTDASTRRVRKIKAPRLTPRAWTAEEVRRLLEQASQEAGCFKRSKVNKAAFWRAFLLTAWDSALRLGDLMSLTTEQVVGRSEFRHVQSKNKHEIVIRLNAETVAAIEATYPPDRALVFRDAIGQHDVSEKLRALVKAAGISPGGSHKIRRSSATAMEIAKPGSATAHLGHLDTSMAVRHYLDQGQIQQHKPMAPALVGGAV